MELDNGIWDTDGIRFSGSDAAAEILARVAENSLAPINASAIVCPVHRVLMPVLLL